jgi:hypothetical protein
MDLEVQTWKLQLQTWNPKPSPLINFRIVKEQPLNFNALTWNLELGTLGTWNLERIFAL